MTKQSHINLLQQIKFKTYLTGGVGDLFEVILRAFGSFSVKVFVLEGTSLPNLLFENKIIKKNC